MADNRPKKGRLCEVVVLFLKLGVIGFGGSAVHIAMMEEEVVVRRKWISHEYFLDLVGLTQVIPGTHSMALAVHLGFLRAGWLGFLGAGLCFAGPAVIITMVLAWVYMQFGAVPEVADLFYGLKPAMIAVILCAIWRLGTRAVKGWRLGFLGLAVALVSLTEFSGMLALLGGGVVGMFWLRAMALQTGSMAAVLPVVGVAIMAGESLAAAGPSLWVLGLFFLKIGAVLYGSEYLMVAFLQEGLVHHYAWLTQEQVLEAVAIGQCVPGPIVSTAAFVGLLVTGGEWLGALVAAGAIFLPSFVFVAALNPVLPRLRDSIWVAAFLDAVGVCALGLMVSVTVELGYLELDEWPKIAIALVATVLGVWKGVTAGWLVLGGALVGWAVLMLGY